MRFEIIPEIERLVLAHQSVRAVRLSRDAERVDPDAVARVRENWYRFNLSSDPLDAEVAIRNYADLDGPWETLGRPPIEDYRLPFGYYRVRLVRDGYQRFYEYDRTQLCLTVRKLNSRAASPTCK